MDEHFRLLNSTTNRSSLSDLDRVITLGDGSFVQEPMLNEDYEGFLSSAVCSGGLYDAAMNSIQPSDIASLQFTSGK
jgi:hypothetical protein